MSVLYAKISTKERLKMSNIKNALDQIANCEICEGAGITDEWATETDFDFEWCDCNPQHLTPENY